MPMQPIKRPCSVPAALFKCLLQPRPRIHFTRPCLGRRVHDFVLPLVLTLFTVTAHAQLGGTMSTSVPASTSIAPSAFGSTSRSTAGSAPGSSQPRTSAAARNSGKTNLAAARSLMNGALQVRTLTDAGNTTINEYAASDGRIVAYTWQGPTMPDLGALLGKYLNSYRAAAADPSDTANGSGDLHASRRVRPDVIVESGGPMRSYTGRAWLPGALPPGVDIENLQ